MGGASSISDDQWRRQDASAELLMRAILLGIKSVVAEQWCDLGSCYDRESPRALPLSAASKVRLKNAVQ